VFVLLGPRGWILYKVQFTAWPTKNPLLNVLKLAAAGSDDAGFTAGLIAVFLILLIVSRRKPAAGPFLYGLFLAVATTCVTIAVLNTRIVAVLGRPFNYQWLYYSDFLKSVDAHEAILSGLRWQLIAVTLIASSAYLVVNLYSGRSIGRRVNNLRTSRWIIVATLLALPLWSLIGRKQAQSHGWPEAKLANPVYEFAQSWLLSSRQPALFTMRASGFESEFAPRADDTGVTPATGPAIRDVILFVMESTPAEYLGVYGSALGVTPNLDRWASQAAVFENIYAHAPATNKSLFSILCSTYPWVSYKSETEEKPDIALPSIVSVLRKRGYATGFFSSGDLQFQSAGTFLRAQGFADLEDYTSRGKNRKIFRSEKWPFLNGSDDVSTAESLAGWFRQRHRAAQPIFGMLWTNMTHYPYFTGSTLQRFATDENLLNRYLNALHAGDEALGTLMGLLERAGIADETVVVVVGDHGEAFGRHKQLTHAGGIYEENCHVPLMFINAKRFHGERYGTVGGLVDIAPTILSILGSGPSPLWQGRSLFSRDRTNRTYFFSPWSDYLFGYRDGNMKFIYNATVDRWEIYNLSRDRNEQMKLSLPNKDRLGESASRLAGWVQYQNHLFRGLIPGGS
jgi:lipoteichoic acid synthase